MPSGSSRLRSFRPAVALDELERVLRRGEDDAGAALRRATAAGPCRARRTAAPGSRSSIQAAAIEPCSASSARASLRECAASAKIASESTVIRPGARAGVAVEQRVVVDDDPVVDPDDRPVADGMVVGRDRRVALRVVADVDQQLVRVGRTATRSSSSEAGVRCLTTVGLATRRARDARSRRRRRRAPRSRRAAPGRRACARRGRRGERLNPAMPHMVVGEIGWSVVGLRTALAQGSRRPRPINERLWQPPTPRARPRADPRARRSSPRRSTTPDASRRSRRTRSSPTTSGSAAPTRSSSTSASSATAGC